jgi:hypothetical protein
MDRDIKKISFYMPDNLNDLKTDIELIINECNKTIQKKVLERHIYNSTISETEKKKLTLIFNKNKQLILDTF